MEPDDVTVDIGEAAVILEIECWWLRPVLDLSVVQLLYTDTPAA